LSAEFQNEANPGRGRGSEQGQKRRVGGNTTKKEKPLMPFWEPSRESKKKKEGEKWRAPKKRKGQAGKKRVFIPFKGRSSTQGEKGKEAPSQGKKNTYFPKAFTNQKKPEGKKKRKEGKHRKKGQKVLLSKGVVLRGKEGEKGGNPEKPPPTGKNQREKKRQANYINRLTRPRPEITWQQ